MGVYIKGMEMPKDEAVALYIYPDGRAKLWRPQAKVGHEFEAVHIPPHGDLIERDALMDSDGDLWDGMWGWSGVQIANAPTIIKAELSKEE